MVLQEGLVRAEVLEFGGREARGCRRVEIVKGVGVDLVEEKWRLSVRAAMEGHT